MTDSKRTDPLRRSLLAALLLASPLLAALGGCDDPFGSEDAVLARDTVTLTAPSAETSAAPSALDITAGNLTRFPEQILDARSWDVALRLEGGTFRLLPSPSAAGRRGGAISGPQPRAFDDLDQATRSRSAYGDTAVTLQVGSAYLLRSRQYNDPILGAGCVRYAKLRAVELNVAEREARIDVVSNIQCDDVRLVED